MLLLHLLWELLLLVEEGILEDLNLNSQEEEDDRVNQT